MSVWGSQCQWETQRCPLGMPRGGRCLPSGLGPPPTREGSGAFLGLLRQGCVCLGDPGDLGASPLPSSGGTSTAVPLGKGRPLPKVIFGANW